MRSGRDAGLELVAPGRSSFEWSVMFAALSLLVPVLAALGLLFAERARRRGSSRWFAGGLAALWCGLLGAFIRIRLGIQVVP